MKKISFVTCCCLIFSIFSSFGDVNAEVKALAHKKMKVQMKIIKYFRKHELEDEKLTNLKKESYKASREYVKARKAHPALKELYAASKKIRDAAVDAKLAKDEAKYKAKMSEYIESRRELEKKALEMDDFKELQGKVEVAREAEQARMREVLSQTEAGKELVTEYNSLEKEIAAVQEKL